MRRIRRKLETIIRANRKQSLSNHKFQLSLEQLESRLLLSTIVTKPLDFSVDNAPIWPGGIGFDKTVTFWDYSAGPWYIPGTSYGVSSFDTSLKARALASTGTIDMNFGGSLRITVPDNVQPGQQDVPITLSSGLSGGTMKSIFGAGFDVPLSFSMDYKIPFHSGTLGFNTKLEDWLPYLGIPVPNDIGWNTTKGISPNFGSYSTISHSDEFLDIYVDFVQVASLLPPPVGTAAAVIDQFIDTNLGVEVNLTAKDNFKPTSLRGGIEVNGQHEESFSVTTGSKTYYIDIPNNVGNSVSLDIEDLSLSNTFYTGYGLGFDPYFEVYAGVPLIPKARIYRHDFPSGHLPVYTLPSTSFDFSITDPSPISIPVVRPTVTVAATDSIASEPGSNTGKYRISRTGSTSQALSVYFDMSGSASNGSDYNTISSPVTIREGYSYKYITLYPKNDDIVEDTESAKLTLNNNSKYKIGSPSNAKVNIYDDDVYKVSVTAIDSSAAEPSSTGKYRINRTGGTKDTITVYYTMSGSATNGTDYNTLSGSVSLSGVSKDITLKPIDDSNVEGTETAKLTLTSNNSYQVVSPSNATVNIADNDKYTITVTAIDPNAAEPGNTGMYKISRSAGAGSSLIPLSVNYTMSGSAKNGTDYYALSGSLTIPQGETYKNITLSPKDDFIDEDAESAVLTLSSNPAYNIGSPKNATVTIIDNDPLPLLSISDRQVTEGNGGSTNATFTVSLSVVSGRTVTVNYATANGSAVAPGDYTSKNGKLTFNQGQTSKTITVPIVGDIIDETDIETFYVNLSGPTNATISDGKGEGRIQDDDPKPKLSINDITVNPEGNSGHKNATFTVSLIPASGLEVTVNYATANGSAVAPGDYTSRNGKLTFNQGQTSKTITVPVVGDIIDETDIETFYVNLSGPTNATISDGKGEGRIQDDDPKPKLSINDITVNPEGNTGTKDATFTVSLTQSSGLEITVNYTTTEGTAKATKDYTSTSGFLTFNPGETSKTIPVSVIGDQFDEDDEEAFYVNLTSPFNADIQDGKGEGMIEDDDPLPEMSIDNPQLIEGNSGTKNMKFAVILDVPSERTVTVNYTTADDTAKASLDYTSKSGPLTFDPGDTTKTIEVPVHGDIDFEFDEYFNVNLSDGTNCTIPNNTGTGTIKNDDQPDMTISGVEVTEGGDAVLTVTLSETSNRTIKVDYTTANDTALASEDYTFLSGTLTFIPGDTSEEIIVYTINDPYDEEDQEKCYVNLSNAVNANLIDDQARITINDNDPLPTIIMRNPLEVRQGETVEFAITLSEPSGRLVNVDYTTINDTAVAPVDYTAISGTLTFIPGQITPTKPIKVQTNNDNEDFEEDFYMSLSNPYNAVIDPDPCVVTITVNDLPTIESLAASPDPVIKGYNLILTANDVEDTDGLVTKVEFYRDTNGNDTLEVGQDEFLGFGTLVSGTRQSGSWRWSGSTSNLDIDNNRFYARAEDNEEDSTESIVADTVTVEYYQTIVGLNYRTVIYTDSDGSAVRVKLKKGVANLVFDGDSLSATTKGKTLTILGKTDLLNVKLQNSNDKTGLSFKVKGGFDGEADLGGLEGNSLGMLNGVKMNLEGDINLSGSLGKAKLNNFENCTIRSGGKIGKVQFNNIDNSLLSAKYDIDLVKSKTNIENSIILAGYDIGPDCLPGTGDEYFNTNGATIKSIKVGKLGNFDYSYALAGVKPWNNDLSELIAPSGETPVLANFGKITKAKVGRVFSGDPINGIYGLFAATEIGKVKYLEIFGQNAPDFEICPPW